MYDELIKRLRECTAEKNGEKTLWHQAADAIEELQQIAGHYEETAHDYFKDVCYYLERVPKWIPVTERLPREQETVLTWGKQGVILLDWRHDNKWCCFGDVTHWMPLPQPPKDGES